MSELLILGSGGPFINPRRASSAFIYTVDDGRRILIDAGGGTFERMGQAGIGAAELELVLLTHFHIDHSGGLAPVVFSAYMEGRTEALTVAGPSGRDGQPGIDRFCAALFGADGAWSYLRSFEGFEITPLVGDSELDEPRADLLLDDRGLVVSTVAVPHGMMPSVAYRIDHGGTSVVFSGDVQSGHEPLVVLARDCDLLVHDLALPERETKHGNLHAKPSEVGRVARDCGCRRLLVNHVMPELEDELDQALVELRRFYDGPLVVAEDLLRVTL